VNFDFEFNPEIFVLWPAMVVGRVGDAREYGIAVAWLCFCSQVTVAA
jgi:hypothetical protein